RTAGGSDGDRSERRNPGSQGRPAQVPGSAGSSRCPHWGTGGADPGRGEKISPGGPRGDSPGEFPQSLFPFYLVNPARAFQLKERGPGNLVLPGPLASRRYGRPGLFPAAFFMMALSNPLGRLVSKHCHARPTAPLPGIILPIL